MRLSIRELSFIACVTSCLSCTPTAAPVPKVAGAAQGSATAGAATGFGESVDVGEHRMYLRCAGEGSPLVVFEAGFGPGGA